MTNTATTTQSISSLIWSVADLLRHNFRQSEYGHVILPFCVLRRLDCVLAATKDTVLETHRAKTAASIPAEPFILRLTGTQFYNVSPMDLPRLMGDQDNLRANLLAYVQGFSQETREIFEHFEFPVTVDRLHKAGLLYLVTEKFANIDLHPDSVSNAQMGTLFEELIRKFSEISNETAGEHFTPREVIRLMVNLLFIEDDEALTKKGVVRSIYDPTAGTGGMLSTAGEHLAGINPNARLTMFGQEINPESYAICRADMLIKGQDVKNIVFGNTLSDDGLPGKQFDYALSNPPFGVEWKKVEKEIRKEAEAGFSGRFGPGLPRVSDGSLLFLLHLISKMRPAPLPGRGVAQPGGGILQGGSRIGIVLNGSPLFTGGAGSGESEIRRYVLENDLVEAIIGLPTDMFYNTGIATYVWILSNRKPEARQGFVQLIDAGTFFHKMRKALGSKRKEMNDDHIACVTRIFGEFLEIDQAIAIDKDGKESGSVVLLPGAKAPAVPDGGRLKTVPVSRIFRNQDFGYSTITVERPLKDEDGKVVVCRKGKRKGLPEADTKLRDTENVPLSEDIEAYFEREVLPHVPDAWIDDDKTKIGYEIPFNRHFYVYEPPRPLEVIDAEIQSLSAEIMTLLREVTA